MSHHSDYCEGICYELVVEGGVPDPNEYRDMIADLRNRFARTDRCTFPFGIQIDGREIKLRFQYYMQYLVEVEGIQLSPQAMSYRHMNNISVFNLGYITALRDLDTARISDAAAPEGVRALAFITSEASRFHMISNGVFQLMTGELSSISYTNCIEMLTRYDRIRRFSGIPADVFRPIVDSNAHLYLSQRPNGGMPRIHDTENVRHYMYG